MTSQVQTAFGKEGVTQLCQHCPPGAKREDRELGTTRRRCLSDENVSVQEQEEA